MFEITVKKIERFTRPGENYEREDSQEIYSQRVESLDLKAVISAVNWKPIPTRIVFDKDGTAL